MKRSEFRELCLSRPMLLDGATGTELVKRGMPAGVCPEQWAVDHPEVLEAIGTAYRVAGSDIVYTCTFGGNREKLREYSLENKLDDINRRSTAINRRTVDAARAVDSRSGAGLVAGDLAPTGRLIEPYGDFPFDDAVAVFREQAAVLAASGADLLVIETMMDIQEARAALIGAREAAPDLPVMVTMTFGENGTTLTGTDPVAALVTLQALGADAVGCNCSAGPEKMLGWIKAMKPYATVPLVAKPNAGQPKLVDGKTVFDMDPETYAAFFPRLVEAGANLVGGCCGSSPAHIAAAAAAVRGMPSVPPVRKSVNAVSSARGVVFIGNDSPFTVIGERINPTGKKKLQAELREGKFALVRQFAQEQAAAGAAMLDVNMGMPGIDEKAMLAEAVKILSALTPLPLCLDSASPEAMEAALRLYPGRALVNSVSAEKIRLEKMLPIAAKYGAMLIVLPLTDEGVPETLPARQKVAGKILEETAKYGYSRDELVMDGLVMTVSSSADAPRVTADFVEWCAKELGMATTGGVSNVSFGMPAREYLNAGFLGILLGRGLTAALLNPANASMMNLKFSSDALLGRDKNFRGYLARYAVPEGDAAPAPAAGKSERSPLEKAFDAVLYGDEENIKTVLQAALDAQIPAGKLVDEALLPAINRVGDLYEKKTYFLPQLMLSAAALSAGFAFLEPHLTEKKGADADSPKIIMATVKGDIHDIGKNIVCLLLRNYGFTVLDLGKDVDEKTIVETALRENVTLVGLSALMTTTMPQMETVINYAKSHNAGHLRFIVGGAVVDRNYAEGIGAEYAEDAVATVKIAKRLCGLEA